MRKGDCICIMLHALLTKKVLTGLQSCHQQLPARYGSPLALATTRTLPYVQRPTASSLIATRPSATPPARYGFGNGSLMRPSWLQVAAYCLFFADTRMILERRVLACHFAIPLKHQSKNKSQSVASQRIVLSDLPTGWPGCGLTQLPFESWNCQPERARCFSDVRLTGPKMAVFLRWDA